MWLLVVAGTPAERREKSHSGSLRASFPIIVNHMTAARHRTLTVEGEPIWNTIEIDQARDEVGDEQMGTKDKFWVRPPDDGRAWLVKLARTHGSIVRGEDWAEWIVHHLANLIGVPTAEVRPALVGRRRGIACRSVLQSELEELVHGNSLMASIYPSYDPTLARHNESYTPMTVRKALEEVLAPTGAAFEEFSGFDVWAGYLVLDAWVAGQDRHHENWAAIRSSDDYRLSPSYDHGNALGFQESDSHRDQLVDDPALLAAWAARGKSHHFAGRPQLVDLAVEALLLADSSAAAYWVERLASVEPTSIERLVSAVPSSVMSDAACRFVLQLLQVNRRRMLDAYRAARPH